MDNLTRVLAATDGSEHGLRAVVTGAEYASRSGASLDVVSIIETRIFPLGIEPAQYHDSLAEEYHQAATKQIAAAGGSEVPVHVRSGLAAPLITQVAEELGTDLLIVGAHPRPAVARILVGSTAERVLRLARCPVLVATEPRHEPFSRILAAIDLSAQSRRVLQTAAKLAQIDRAGFRALYVQDRLTPMLLEAALFDEKESRHHARSQFSKTLADVSLPSELMMSREIREGHPGHEILHEAESWKADLIVMGSHGFGFFNRLLLGSISLYVLRHGHTSVVVVPRSEGEA
ncbi:MAG: universal stress protein [Gemmatimonadota bacterium]|nr:MAG: universal stress protein [Gemmatimonadota bacterium]